MVGLTSRLKRSCCSRVSASHTQGTTIVNEAEGEFQTQTEAISKNCESRLDEACAIEQLWTAVEAKHEQWEIIRSMVVVQDRSML